MLEEDAPLLAGVIVQRVDLARELAVLRLRAPGATFFLMIVSGRVGPRVGLSRTKPFKGEGVFTAPASIVPLGEKLRARTRLNGSRVIGIGAHRIFLTGEGGALVLEASAAPGSRVVLRDAAEGEIVGEEAAASGDIALLCERGEQIARSFGESALDAKLHDLQRSLSRAITRVGRRIQAIESDLARIDVATALATTASAFVAEASRAPRGATSLEVVSWSTGEPETITIALDPSKGARAQIDAMFARARRLKHGAVIARRRLTDAEALRDALLALAEEAKGATSFASIDALVRQARAAAPRAFALLQGAPTRKVSGAAPRLPYRVFRGALGARILVGRGAAANDALSFHVAKPHDLWLHAKGHAGAHVVVPLDKGHVCASDVLVEAALLAAHFSDARDALVVEIAHTQRRHLRKPRGSAPGFVIVDREKVLVLRVERERLTALLGREEIGEERSPGG